MSVLYVCLISTEFIIPGTVLDSQLTRVGQGRACILFLEHNKEFIMDGLTVGWMWLTESFVSCADGARPH